jgi:hypothetical protein
MLMPLPFLYRTGKTLLAKTLARYVNVPFVIADATAITQVMLAAIAHVLSFFLIYLAPLIRHAIFAAIYIGDRQITQLIALASSSWCDK